MRPQWQPPARQSRRTQLNENNYTVEVSKRATDMLKIHACMLAQSGRHVGDFLDAFENSARTLQNAPKQYPMLQGRYLPEHKYHQLKIDRHFLIIYQIVGNKVYIEDVVNTDKDYAWMM